MSQANDTAWLDDPPAQPPSTPKIISQAEARAAGLTRFFTGEPCVKGHIAERWVSNPRVCVDCNRDMPVVPENLKRGVELSERKRHERRTQRIKDRVDTVVAEQDKILEVYAQTRDFDAIAKFLGISVAQLDAKVSSSKILHDAIQALEKRLLIVRKLPEKIATVEVYEWTEEKRLLFLEVYVNTGDVASARDAIKVTPSEFNRETQRNDLFAKAVDEAEAQAHQALEERAIQLALKGNDRLLVSVLKAKNPDFREKLDLSVKGEVKLNDQQLDEQLLRLARKHRERIGHIIDAEFSVVEPGGEVRALENAGGVRSDADAKQVLDTVSDDWLTET